MKQQTLLPGKSFSDLLQKDMFTPFTQSLIEMDSRFRIYTFYDEIFPDKGFYPHKEEGAIYIPCGIPHIEHEVAHMVEMKNLDRCLLPDWGLTISDDRTSAKSFFAALSRETRVRAIQKHMNPEMSKLGPLSNQHYWEPEAKARLPFGRFKSYQDLEVWVQSLYEKTYQAWSLDRIKTEWQTRLSHIQNWMETQAVPAT